MDGILVGLLVALGVLLVAGLVLRRWWETPSPQRAVVFPGSGFGTSGDGANLRVVVGRPRLVLPPRRHRGELNLGTRNLEVAVDCETNQALRVIVTVHVIYRVGNSIEQIRRAALRFLKDPEQLLEGTVKNLVLHNIRTIIGEGSFHSLLFEQTVVTDRFKERVRQDFQAFGLVLENAGIVRVEDVDGHGEGYRRAAVVEARLKRDEAERRLRVETARADADAAAEVHDHQLRSHQLELQIVELNKDLERKNAELAARNAQLAMKDDLAKADLERKLHDMKVDQDAYATAQRIAQEKAEREARNATDIELRRALDRSEAERLMVAAKAEGLKMKEQIQGLSAAEAHNLITLTLAKDMHKIAAAAKVELPNLEKVIQSGGDTSSLLNNLIGIGLPIAEMVGEVFNRIREADPAHTIAAPPPQEIAPPTRPDFGPPEIAPPARPTQREQAAADGLDEPE
ncbi:SPFH domain-containing protein [Acrocarpospora catenulata]|uniref:SPFH domain-containing protein n=1 Tax=Acrocarpospora catenulata TaxID=2836182 RepID=UPI001BDABCE3|nr:SPFH domain-containing protein [Acrocarpospora catenulata]